MADRIEESTLAERLKARRAAQGNDVRESSEARPVPQSIAPDTPGGVAERLQARRAKQAESASQGGKDEGEGSIGQEIAREPLFVSLGMHNQHHAGQKDSEAPPVKSEASTRAHEDLGAPDPQPAPSRRPRR